MAPLHNQRFNRDGLLRCAIVHTNIPDINNRTLGFRLGHVRADDNLLRTLRFQSVPPGPLRLRNDSIVAFASNVQSQRNTVDRTPPSHKEIQGGKVYVGVEVDAPDTGRSLN